MAGDKGRALSQIWQAAYKRQEILEKHPSLAQLEKDVAQAIINRVTQGGSDEQIIAARQARDAFLKDNSIPANYAEPQWSCEQCQDEGFVDGAPCSCRRQADLESRFRSSGLPELLRKQTFSRFDLKWYSSKNMTPGRVSERKRAELVRQACQTFVAEVLEKRNPRGLFIFGEVGLGKTFLLSAICNSLVEAGVPTLYAVFSDLIGEIKRSFGTENKAISESTLMDAARTAEVLILDDLGAEQITDFVTNRLFDIVNYRRIHQKPLVLSSNLSIEELGSLYGSRISSRISEMCTPLTIYGQDIRWQKERQD